ncbi:alpha/beta-hydrolase [Westerdykella ornata]|uniref:Alpha/beta-hydrolase n=1 Tax=Westerdykella ornata TaxID=318751 RepID=A0A6A6JEE0_WESOR|nr:alpha/beta-hydrolase [Westerdykella ornata]KAF2274657.1 alpha/beta-hydrolase [Westerdykella ornata]
MADSTTRFNAFNVHTTAYKKVGNHEIAVSVLIPKTLNPGRHPLVVKIHGGGLVLGEALYKGWFAAWLVSFILRNNAIAVLPNYRLIPESNGKDIMEDLADFWKWFDEDLQKWVSSINEGIALDFDRVLVSGDSAGGLLALQSAFTQPEGKIKAVLAQYPMTNILRRDPIPSGVLPNGAPAPGPEYIDQHIASIKPGTIISSSVPYDRMPLSYALSAYGRWQEFYGTDKNLLPITAIEDAKYLPRTFIFHGEQDTAVSVEDTKTFVEKAKEVLGDKVDIKLVTVKGQDHGFDCVTDVDEEKTEWLKEGLKFVEQKWLA